MEKILNKCIYIQIWAKQNPTKFDSGNTHTKDYFDRLFGMVQHVLYANEMDNNAKHVKQIISILVLNILS